MNIINKWEWQHFLTGAERQRNPKKRSSWFVCLPDIFAGECANSAVVSTPVPWQKKKQKTQLLKYFKMHWRTATLQHSSRSSMWTCCCWGSYINWVSNGCQPFYHMVGASRPYCVNKSTRSHTDTHLSIGIVRLYTDCWNPQILCFQIQYAILAHLSQAYDN